MIAERLAGPWFDTRTAQEYIPCKTPSAVYAWCRRYHVVRSGDGKIAKADIDRVKRSPRPRRRMSPNSLANLSKRHARTVAPQPETVSRESLAGCVSC